MHRLELDDIKTIRKNAVGFAFEKMFGFIGSNVGHGGENVGAMCGRAFDAVAMVDAAFASFMVDIEVLKVIVEVHGAST